VSAIRELGVRPLVVLGGPKSGTTLVEGLLEPSQWGNAFEAHFITKHALEGKQVDLSKSEVYLREQLSFLEYRAAEDQIDQLASQVRSNRWGRFPRLYKKLMTRLIGQNSCFSKTSSMAFE
jgi:hypothetical protein